MMFQVDSIHALRYIISWFPRRATTSRVQNSGHRYIGIHTIFDAFLKKKQERLSVICDLPSVDKEVGGRIQKHHNGRKLSEKEVRLCSLAGSAVHL